MGKTDLLNERIAGIAPSETLGIASIAKKLMAEGKKVYSFAAGEPDFDTPEYIKDAATAALKQGKTKYTPAAGLTDLCTAIVEKLKKENGLVYEPKQIVVSCGAKHSLFNVIMTVCRDGDEVIVPGPYWLSYPEMIRIAGGTPVCVCADEDKGLKPSVSDIEKAITGRTKAIIINSPCNPSGVVYDEEELKAIAELAIRRDFFVISDEIYEKMVYDGIRQVSTASFSKDIQDRTITVNGFSKAWSMTGWRLGYIAAPVRVAQAVTAFQSHSTSAPNTFAQYGGVAAIRGDGSDIAEMVKAFGERRDYMYERLSAIPGVRCVKPKGAFYMFPNISHFGLKAGDFAARLLQEQGVAAVPGTSFGSDRNIRLSYACSKEEIREGMDRLARFTQSLRPA